MGNARELRKQGMLHPDLLKIVKQLEKEGKSRNEFIKELRKYKEQMREAIGRQIVIKGELDSYTSLFLTISRIITLRTSDKKEYNR